MVQSNLHNVWKRENHQPVRGRTLSFGGNASVHVTHFLAKQINEPVYIKNDLNVVRFCVCQEP